MHTVLAGHTAVLPRDTAVPPDITAVPIYSRRAILEAISIANQLL